MNHSRFSDNAVQAATNTLFEELGLATLFNPLEEDLEAVSVALEEASRVQDEEEAAARTQRLNEREQLNG